MSITTTYVPTVSRRQFLEPMVVEYISQEKDLTRLVREYSGAPIIYADFEASGLDPRLTVPWLLALSQDNSNIVHVIDVQRVSRCPSLTEALDGDPSIWGGIAILKDVLENSIIGGANLSYDLKLFRRHGIRPRKTHDIVIMSRMLSAGLFQDNSLKANTERYLGFTMEKEVRESFIMHPDTVRRLTGPPIWTKAQLDYAATDVFTLEPLITLQKEHIVREDLAATAEVENDTVPIVGDMEYDGIFVDREEWLALAIKSEEEKKSYYEEVCEVFAEHGDLQTSLFPELTGNYIINLNSNPMVQARLKLLGITVKSLDKGELNHTKDPVLAAYVKYKEYDKRVGTYGAKWIANIHPVTGRIHAHLNQIMDTGRFSSSKPNIQNLPAVKEYRYCFKPKPGYKYVDCDFSQMELRILAHMSGDKNMIDIFESGIDMHTATAAKMFKKPIEECGKGSKWRHLGKTINFAM